MMWTLQFYVCLITFATNASPEVMTPFPLENCESDDIDLLLIAEAAGNRSTLLERMEKQAVFFKELIDMFLSPEEVVLTRLNVAVASVTSTGPSVLISFQPNKTRGELETEISNLNYTDSQLTDSEPKPQSVVEFAKDAFSQISDDKRGNATRVVIVVMSNYASRTAEDLSVYQSVDYQINELRILVALVGYENASIKVGHTNNIVTVASFGELVNNQRFSMAICQKCSYSWFVHVHSDSQSELSCYKLLNYTKDTSWLDASNECENYKAQLVSIETEEEFKLLLSRVYELLLGDHFMDPGGLHQSIYIGLTRNVANQDQGFRWINHRPLTVSHWLDNAPGGGYVQNCVMWTILKNPGSFFDATYVNFWMDIGCGQPFRYMALCEVFESLPRKSRYGSLTVRAANETSYDQALRRGEFLDVQGKIISVPVNAEDPSVAKILHERKQSFKLFNCENDETRAHAVSYLSVCDHIRDCKNGQDELICQYRRCDPASEFTCLSKQCIPLESRCDLYKDCLDESDEVGCKECKGLRCCDGTCLPRHWFHDGEVDCASCNPGFRLVENPGIYIDDETGEELGDEHCTFICNRTECIFPSQLNDGVVDCKGPEGPLDEMLGKLETIDACKNQFQRFYWSPRCVYIKDRYGSVLGCRDMSHLRECANFTCPEGYIKCPESYCIPLHSLYDGIMDCPFGEDERYVEDHDCIGNFDCWNSDICVHPDLVCDGQSHCPFGDDELACRATCAKGFLCIAGTVTVTDYDKSIPLHSLVFIDPRTRYLDMSGVDLSVPIEKEDRGQFINLTELRLSGCQLHDALGSFVLDVHGLDTVYWMDLSHNLIQEITQDSMFTHMTNLHELNLSYNQHLTFIHSAGLSSADGVSLLKMLDLSHTGLTYIDKDALQQLPHLRMLNLSYTSLNNLNSHTFPENFMLNTLDLRKSQVKTIRPDSLKGLTISSHLYTDNYKLCCPQLRGSGIPDHTCHAPQDAISSCSDLIADNAQRVLLWLIGLLAVLGNITVLMFRLVCYRDNMKTATGMFVTHLGFSDFIMGVYLLIIAGADTLYSGTYVWNEEAWRHSLLCKVAGFLSTLSSETSMFFIFLITLDRYLVIQFPFGQHKFSKSGIAVSVALSWVIGFLLALIPVLPVFSSWVMYSSNGMCLGLPLTNERLPGWAYSMAVFIVLNFVMFLFIAFGQLLIYRAMSKNRAAKSVTQSNSRRAQDIEVAKRLSLVVLSDFWCWFPIGLMGLLAMCGHNIDTEAYAWSAVLILPINSALNPLMYTIPILLQKWEKYKLGDAGKTISKVSARARSTRNAVTNPSQIHSPESCQHADKEMSWRL